MPSRSPSGSRGRSRSRSPYSDVSVDRKVSRSPSPARRTVSPRDASRSPRRNGKYRSESRSLSRGRSPSPVRSTKVVIEKLTKNITKEHLEEIFGAYGQIKDLDMPMNKTFMTNRGTAYILYTSEADAESAIAHMHEGQIDGASINVSIVLPRRKFSPSPPTARRGANIDPRNNYSRFGAPPGPPVSRRRSPPPSSYGRDPRDSRVDRNHNTYRGRSRSRSPRRHRTRSRSLSSRSRSPPRRGRGGGGGGGGGNRRDSFGRTTGKRRRSLSYSSYSSYDSRSRSRSIGRGGDNRRRR